MGEKYELLTSQFASRKDMEKDKKNALTQSELPSSQFASRKDMEKDKKKALTQSELLAPVGDFRNLRAAVEAGADAVYFGIRGFNMRDSARNFSVRNLEKIREICGDVKMYLTLNVVVYDGELKRVEEIVGKVKGKIDAIICWDLAVINLCRKYRIPFHVSTQASVSNVEAAKFYKKLGAERIVLARELSLKQIAKISRVLATCDIHSKKGTNVPSSSCKVECFCHGAMCVAVSGRCFMSQYTTGLSANRGKCTQPCRRAWRVETADAVRPSLGSVRSALPVRSSLGSVRSGLGCENVGVNIKDDSGNEFRLENSRVMSAKDLCALPFIEKMKKAGVRSFKIEGRNRGPEYVSTVVREYRKALDRELSKEEISEGIHNLKKVYHRGFSSGFYLKMPTADDFSFSEHGEQEERKEFVGRVYKFWRKVGAASVLVNTGRLKAGDEVYLISDDIGVRRAVVKSIELEGKRVSVAKKGDDVGVVFGQVVGGRGQVSGVRGQRLGDRLQGVGSRLQVAGGRLQVAGVGCQGSGGRCQVSGVRGQVAEERIGSGTEVYVIRKS